MNANKTPEQLMQSLKDLLNTNLNSLNSIIDKIPEALRADLVALRDSLNNKLKALQPLDQIPLAEQAAYALNCLMDGIVRMQEYTTLLMSRLTAVSDEASSLATAKNALQKKIDDGELLTKEKVTELCELAKEDVRKEIQPQVIDLRKEQIKAAGLPAPAETVLSANSKDFQVELDRAKLNLETAKKRGLKLGGKGDALFKNLLWGSETAFNSNMDSIGEIMGKKAGEPLMSGDPDTDAHHDDRKGEPSMAIG